MKHSSEAFWWSLFSAGGVMAALFMPAVILTTGILLPFASGSDATAGYAQVHETLGPWFVRLALFGIIFVSLCHCAHRIKHILMDIGWRSAHVVLAVGCYGGAFAASIVAAVFLMRMNGGR